jgi:hypothetical protein
MAGRQLAEHGINVLDELIEEPQVVKRPQGVIDLVFDATAESCLWKDVIIAHVANVPPRTSASPSECFYDLVADRPHRVSLGDRA